MPCYAIELPAELESLRIAAPFTEAVLQELPDLPERDRLVHDLQLVTSEALTNALRHSSHSGSQVRLKYSLDPDAITITVTDFGVGFDPDSVRQPDFDECPEGGYGLFIMKSIMDDVRYEKTDDGNNLLLIKKLNGS